MWDSQTLEAHWLACMASAAGGGQATRLIGATVLTNPSCAATMLNCITLRNADPQRLEGLLAAGSAVLASLRRPPALFLSPAAGQVAALQDRLTSLGWQRRLRQAVLVRPLDETLPEPPLGVEVVGREAEAVEAWADLLLEAYQIPAGLGDDVRRAWSRFADEGAVRRYRTCDHGEPAGTGLTWLQGGIAGLYAGAVLPAHRRRGLERASLLRRMADARAEGAHLAFLQTEVGSPVVHLCVDRLGFTLAYERELWLPGRPVA